MDKYCVPIDYKPIEVARLNVGEKDILDVLGEPHYIETDSTRTAGGKEWFWVFQKEGVKFAYLYRHPYQEMDILVENLKNNDVLALTKSLFNNCELEVYEEAYQHL